MSYTGTVILKAVTAPGPQVWTINVAATAEDAVALDGTPGSSIQEITNNAVQLFAISDAINSIPDNATITDLTIVANGDGNPGGECFVRFGLQTDSTFHILRSGNNSKSYPDMTDFGNPGVPWTRGILNSNNADLICGNLGNIVINSYYFIVTFTVPDSPDPSSAVIAGGTTIEFGLSSGTFFDAFYEVVWTSSISAGPFPLVVVDGHTGENDTPVLTGFPFPSQWGVTISDPEANDSGGIRPYNRPTLVTTVTGLENDFMQFLEDPLGTPTEYAITGGVTMGSSYVGYLSKDISGIYTLVPDKRNDTVYVRAGSTTTQDVQIPTPFAEFGFVEADDE